LLAGEIKFGAVGIDVGPGVSIGAVTGAGTAGTAFLTGMNSAPFWPHPVVKLPMMKSMLKITALRIDANIHFTIKIVVSSSSWSVA